MSGVSSSTPPGSLALQSRVARRL
eukprot:COSAG01_NODE_63604_length_279_cov_0.861111_1_plen_23_part_01